MDNQPQMIRSRVFFSSADHVQEDLLGAHAAETFENSLLLNLLFGTGVIIPDSFFFSSRCVGQHIFKTGKTSLLEVAVKEGFIVPAFRRPVVSSFTAVLENIKRDGVRGLQPNAEQVAATLQRAADQASRFSPEIWPEYDLGDRFDRFINVIQSKEPPRSQLNQAIDEAIHDMWQRTEVWRTRCVDDARVRTAESAGRGLRRGEIWIAVGKAFGRDRIDYLSELLSLGRNEEERRALWLFCRWISDCYELNMANAFGCMPNIVDYDPISGLMISSILPSESSDQELMDSPVFQESVVIPPLKMLQAMSPSELLRIRNELGAHYLVALENWQRSPSQAKMIEVSRTLKEYTGAIVKSAQTQSDFGPRVLQATLGAQKTPTQRLLHRIMAGAGLLAASKFGLGPLIVFASTVAGIGYAAYQVQAHHTTEIALEFDARNGLPTPGAGTEVEVCLPSVKQ